MYLCTLFDISKKQKKGVFDSENNTGNNTIKQ